MATLKPCPLNIGYKCADAACEGCLHYYLTEITSDDLRAGKYVPDWGNDALRSERDAAVERLQEYRDDVAKVLNEKCPTDERHCGCVPTLRKANHCYRNALVLITTMTDVSEMRTIADKALGESLADVSAAKACGEYWVQQLDQRAYEYDVLEDKCATLEKDLTEVCRLRLEAADSFSKQIIELENKVRELEAAARWIPVSERPPEGYTRILIANDSYSGEGVYKPQHDPHEWYWNTGDPAYRITHWMPLPQPPESEVTHDQR